MDNDELVDDDDEQEEEYLLADRDRRILDAMISLLWKASRAAFVRPVELMSVGKALQ